MRGVRGIPCAVGAPGAHAPGALAVLVAAGGLACGFAGCQGPPGEFGEADANASVPELPDGNPQPLGDAWPPDRPLPAAFDMPPWVTMPAPNHIVIGWRTTRQSAGAVRVGEASRPGFDRTVASDGVGYLHRVDLGVLAPATTYHYQVAVAGTGAVRDGTFTTPGRESWRFVHMGEAHAPSENHNVAAFTDVIRQFQPHVLIESGDMVDAGSLLDHWRGYLRNAAPWISNVILLPAHSNHANGFQGNPYILSMFALPDNGRWYTTRYGQVEVFSLDSSFNLGTNPDIADQGAFIRERASAARDGDDDPAFVIAAWHYPACSSHYASRAFERVWVRGNFIAAFADAGGLDLALVGHDKYYERSVVTAANGTTTVHVMTNAGRLAPSVTSPAETGCQPVLTDTTARSLGLYTVEGERLTGAAVTPGGAVIDQFVVPRRESP